VFRPRVAVIHNRYQQPGGEDVVFERECELLERRGHDVVRYALDNRALADMRRLELARATVWNGAVFRELRDVFATTRPHVAHFHNTFPLVSPAGYYAARREGVRVVQTLHNFRLGCANALFFRDGHVCTECSGRTVPWPALLHACYRGSRAATGVTAAMLAIHHMLGTWTNLVDVYVALTDFARERFIEHGLPARKIVVKPNFVGDDPGVGAHRGGFALYVGRLTTEKGVGTLLDAWSRLPNGYRLKIVGGGALASRADGRQPGIEWLGHLPPADVASLMREAAFLVFPSEWYETFGLTIVEAFASGMPVVASNIGAAGELVTHARNGLHFRAGDAADLAARLEWAFGHEREMDRMGRTARATFESTYTADRNYGQLLDIYRTALAQPATGATLPTDSTRVAPRLDVARTPRSLTTAHDEPDHR
jgi:glycosyltransferase involved in cell wall biosynthesis